METFTDNTSGTAAPDEEADYLFKELTNNLVGFYANTIEASSGVFVMGHMTAASYAVVSDEVTRVDGVDIKDSKASYNPKNDGIDLVLKEDDDVVFL